MWQWLLKLLRALAAQAPSTSAFTAPFIAFVKRKEGCKLHAYQDAVGVWTIGYGHTGGVAPGDTITQARADALLMQDLAAARDDVLHATKRKLTQAQLEALTSFVFNLGAGAYERSTLKRKLEAGDLVGAANEFQRWNHADGRVLPGLTDRRREEALMFMGRYPA